MTDINVEHLGKRVKPFTLKWEGRRITSKTPVKMWIGLFGRTLHRGDVVGLCSGKRNFLWYHPDYSVVGEVYSVPEESKATLIKVSQPVDLTDKTPPRKHSTLALWLAQRPGFSLIGHGAFSYVLATPNPRYVIKVSSQKHAEGHRWITRLCQDYPHLPFLPKLYREVTWGDSYVTQMERLQAVPRAVFVSWLKSPPGREFRKFITPLARKDGRSIDFGSRNFMLRGSQVVAVDPVT